MQVPRTDRLVPRRFRLCSRLAAAAALVGTSLGAQFSQVDDTSFVNWESPHVHPLDLTPDGATLLAVNTADATLEVFDVTGSEPVHRLSVPVGLDPVSVRARSNTEAWVVNHVSDSVSIVDVTAGRVVATLWTEDEPADVVFAGDRAFVSCSQTNALLVFDLDDRKAKPVRIPIRGEDPRALAVSANGDEVYVGVFESGNRTTILPGGFRHVSVPDAVGHVDGPYGGINPPPNRGTEFSPAIRGDLPAPPAVGLIVRQADDGLWKDDNGADWTAYVSGERAHLSGRPQGWTLLDHDLAIVSTDTLDVRYRGGLMNVCAALSVSPQDGTVAVVGTEARNEVRYVQNLAGRFVHSRWATVDSGGALGGTDLNPHLGADEATVETARRDRSLADPRGVAWSGDGQRAFVTGMGSNNLVIVDASGARAGRAPAIEVGEGPTGVVHDRRRDRVFVLNRFGSSISTVDPVGETVLATTAFHDATPAALREGRRFLYDAHATSGTGAVSCASCHLDARMDRLAWDLGDPQGDVKPVEGNLGAGIFGSGVGDLRQGFRDWHPMKGPMVTQTLQDIIGKEPFHWRGDRTGIEQFRGTFARLLGDDEVPDDVEMQRFEDYLATIAYPPNPYREIDNGLSSNVPLPSPVIDEDGVAIHTGDAANGRRTYKDQFPIINVYCASCHSLPTGGGANQVQDMFQLTRYRTLPFGPNGERHQALFSIGGGGSDNVTMKGVQLRNLYEKTGFDLQGKESVVGFGFRHDSSMDTLPRLLTMPFDHGMPLGMFTFAPTTGQTIADMVAFLLSMSGETRSLPRAFLGRPRGGTPSLSTHAGVGRQWTLNGAPETGELALLGRMIALAEEGTVGLVVRTGDGRGFVHDTGTTFQSDRAVELVDSQHLIEAAAPGSEVTWTLVPFGSRLRLGLDRDEDGVFDRDELDAGSDPRNADDRPRRARSSLRAPR